MAYIKVMHASVHAGPKACSLLRAVLPLDAVSKSGALLSLQGKAE